MDEWKSFGLLKILLAAVLAFEAGVAAADSETRTLDELIALAIEKDPWFEQNRATQRSLQLDSIAAGELPDPRLTASLANLPIDTFSFSQEPMTQFNIGVAQTFPGGDTRSLKRQRFEQLGAMSPVERAERRAQVALIVARLWIDIAVAAARIELIETERVHFEQLADVTGSGYGSASGRINQQDVIRAQLEITRLDERVLRLREQQERRIAQLSEWVPREVLSDLEWSLPAKSLHGAEPTHLTTHPAIVLIDQKIAVARTEVDLADQASRPGFTISTNYAYRDKDMTGRDLPDFFSVGVTMDLPLFQSRRQDKTSEATAQRAAALESARLARLRQLQARQGDAHALLARLEDQSALYEEEILQQLVLLAESALNAYASDQGDFADVMRAYIAQLNARLESLRLEAERQNVIAELEYLRASVANNEEFNEE